MNTAGYTTNRISRAAHPPRTLLKLSMERSPIYLVCVYVVQKGMHMLISQREEN